MEAAEIEAASQPCLSDGRISFPLILIGVGLRDRDGSVAKEDAGGLDAEVVPQCGLALWRTRLRQGFAGQGWCGCQRREAAGRRFLRRAL